jgi:hypothetical protein
VVAPLFTGRHLVGFLPQPSPKTLDDLPEAPPTQGAIQPPGSSLDLHLFIDEHGPAQGVLGDALQDALTRTSYRLAPGGRYRVTLERLPDGPARYSPTTYRGGRLHYEVDSLEAHARPPLRATLAPILILLGTTLLALAMYGSWLWATAHAHGVTL